jgi:hypothetical protein
METIDEKNSVCCPEFSPEPWNDKIFQWENKKFIKERVRTFFYMPLNFGRVMRKIDSSIRAFGANIEEALCLSDHTSRWNMDLYLAIDREVPGTENTVLSGKFYSRIYEGPYSDTAKWCRDFESRSKEKGLKIKKWYMWYTTCPKCAKKYGKNYVGIVSLVESQSET